MGEERQARFRSTQGQGIENRPPSFRQALTAMRMCALGGPDGTPIAGSPLEQEAEQSIQRQNSCAMNDHIRCFERPNRGRCDPG